MLTALSWVGQRTDLDHHADRPPLTWHVEARGPGLPTLNLCDPVTGRLTAVPYPPPDWPALTDPPELRDAAAVLWLQGTGHARVSAAVHTAWFAAVNRGLDATVVVGLETSTSGTTRVAALALGPPTRAFLMPDE